MCGGINSWEGTEQWEEDAALGRTGAANTGFFCLTE